MKKEKLLKFFNEKNELVNQNKAFTSFNLKCVNRFDFVVSNQKGLVGNSVEIKSIKDLIDAVKEYYSQTKKDYRECIVYSPNVNKESELFVTPKLLVL
ncbi:hypothetical protein FEZ18_03780 [Oceanihabitans sp. IOP_32]|uniref:hypothetical protein n=1 Tax=Oceanihabitans sp. IOP_32 TaxID=2529032 RepID=UPI001293D560|nr:hypothetical protein [Oceanihabitans sp. IOP_32]QFZ53987.1 hypothetical protein FEZ18_03780 [Oceanihabitans sp. IOP_32]